MRQQIVAMRKSGIVASVLNNKRQIGAWLWLCVLVTVGINFPMAGMFLLGMQLQAILSGLAVYGKQKVIDDYKWLFMPRSIKKWEE